MSFATAALALNPFEKFAATTKRDERDPYVMFNYDRMINYGAIAIPGMALVTSFFIGNELFTADGLQPINPRDRDGSLRFDRWTELGVAKSYCWAHLGITSETTQSSDYLYHYACFPYVLMLLSLMLYLVQITWRFSDLDRLTSVLDFILDGLEESIRDIMEFLLEEDGDKKFVAKPISRCNSDDRLIATQIDMEDIRNDLIDTVDEKIVKVTEKNLWDQLIEYHKEKKVCAKYRKFRLLLEHFSTSNTIRHAYMMRRTMLVMLNMISKLIIFKSNGST